MSSSAFLLLFSACVLFTCSSAEKSCRNRCGEAYVRGNECQCDYECLSHRECCRNYESVCTSRESCKGRCGESFKRGRQCHCDIECIKFNQCCPDYETQCNIDDSSMEEEFNNFTSTNSPDDMETEDAESGSQASPYDAAEVLDPFENLPGLGTVPSTIEDPELLRDFFKPEQLSSNSSAPNPQALTMLTTPTMSATHTTPAPQQNLELTMKPNSTDPPDNPKTSTTKSPQSVLDLDQFSDMDPTYPPQITSTTPNYSSISMPKETFSPTTQANNPDPQPSNPIQLEDTQDPENPLEDQLDQNDTTTMGLLKKVSTDKPSGAGVSETPSENQDIKGVLSTNNSPTLPGLLESTLATVTMSPSPTKVQEKPTNPQDNQDYQADTTSDTNVCSKSPVNGLTTLRNGTIVVFRGHYFWMLDSRRNAGPAHLIRDFWGISSPIDTVFTRCNCKGKTYIFKEDKYWRFENDLMDAGFPRPISEGFGLDGHVQAALSMPQYRSRKESVLFFKKGGLAQRYTYHNTPNCGSKSAAIVVKRAFKRETVPELGVEIVINKTWIGFPSSVTSAVSVQAAGGDGYKYYVFSPTKYYSVKVEGNTPVILTPKAGRENQKSAKSWLKCQETKKTTS